MGYISAMTHEAQKTVDRRLARIEGQVRGLRRMLDEGAYCCDMLTQLTAVKSAIEQVAALVASQHIRHCIAGHDGGTVHAHAVSMSKDELLDELDDVLGRLVR